MGKENRVSLIQPIEVVAENKYIEIHLTERKKKTSVYRIIKKQGFNNILGEIRWFRKWRQYCFFPVDGTIFNDGCLITILDFLEKLKKKRRGRGG